MRCPVGEEYVSHFFLLFFPSSFPSFLHLILFLGDIYVFFIIIIHIYINISLSFFKRRYLVICSLPFGQGALLTRCIYVLISNLTFFFWIFSKSPSIFSFISSLIRSIVILISYSFFFGTPFFCWGKGVFWEGKAILSIQFNIFFTLFVARGGIISFLFNKKNLLVFLNFFTFLFLFIFSFFSPECCAKIQETCSSTYTICQVSPMNLRILWE